MNWNDFQDIKQLECMIRAHVILAQLVQPSSSEYKNYLLKMQIKCIIILIFIIRIY